MNARFSAASLAMLGLALGGCVNLPGDRGAAAVRELIETRSPVAGAVNFQPRPEELESRLLASPIGVEAAVRLALTGNPRVRQLFAELGFAAADIDEATRLANPGLSFLELSSDAVAGGAKTTWGLAQSFTELLFQPYRARVGRAEQIEAQQRVAHAMLELEAEVREAFYSHAAAVLATTMRRTAARAALLSADLAQRFHEAGNVSLLQLSHEQAAASEATIGEQRVIAAAVASRNRLLALLGLRSDDERPQFVTTLDIPVALDVDVTRLEQLARERRLDFAALRTRSRIHDEQLEHTRRWRWLRGLGLNAEREREPDGEVRKGGGASIELPVFNRGQGALFRAESRAESTAAELAAMELGLAGDLSTQLAALQAAHAIAEEYRLRLLPLRERIVETSQREQNFMLIGAFELLTARREELDTYEGYIDAVRDYWIERTRLARLTGGALPGDATTEPLSLPSVEDGTGTDHADHGGAQ